MGKKHQPAVPVPKFLKKERRAARGQKSNQKKAENKEGVTRKGVNQSNKQTKKRRVENAVQNDDDMEEFQDEIIESGEDDYVDNEYVEPDQNDKTKRKFIFSDDEEEEEDDDDEIELDEEVEITDESEKGEGFGYSSSDESEELDRSEFQADKMAARAKPLDASDDEDDDEEEEEEEQYFDPEEPERPQILPDELEIYDDDDESDEDESGMLRLRGDLEDVQQRIQDILRVLSDFQNMKEPNRSRAEYLQQLISDIATFYGYSNYLAEKLFGLFSPTEAVAFFEANESPRPVTIRTNTLKTSRKQLAEDLLNRGINISPIPGKWSKHGLQVFDSKVPVGATPEYLAGHYIIQSASSFVPVLALDPQPNERILDMASAPGGKSTYISALMQNTGVVFANDSGAKERLKALSSNSSRLGCTNMIVCSLDGRSFPKVIGGFNRVLLDAPCSGMGVISKDPSAKTSKTHKDFQRMSDIQKQLLLHALDSVVAGGVVVYSTCSVTLEENEAVVEYALKKRPGAKLVDIGVEIGKEGFVRHGGITFSAGMSKTRRLWPHVHNMDGFFVAKLVVVCNTLPPPNVFPRIL